MKHLLWCLTLSALSAFGGAAGGSSAPLTIYTDFRFDPTPAIESSIRSEVASLVAPIGLGVQWRSLAAPRLGETSAALLVVTFMGRCETGGIDSHRPVTGPLAWTHISDGEILPFIDIDCDKLRELLEGKLQQQSSKAREQLFGRAIARVLGHELYHVFAETKHHGKGGMTQPAFTSTELLSDDFDFGEKELRILLVSKLRSLLSFRMPFRDRATPSGRAEYKAEGCGACHGGSGQGSPLAPALRAKSLTQKTMTARFEKKREEMYRRARSMKLDWLFPTDEEIVDIVAALNSLE